MGSGKTTLSRALSRMTGIRTVDLDEYIALKVKMSIKRFFECYGEAAFREVERESLMELAGESDLVVACGGGTPCFGSNMELMNSKGTTILLEASTERLHSRLIQGRYKRPLIASLNDEQLLEFIIEKQNDREPWYGKAAHRFDSTLLENDREIDSTVRRFVSIFLSEDYKQKVLKYEQQ